MKLAATVLVATTQVSKDGVEDRVYPDGQSDNPNVAPREVWRNVWQAAGNILMTSAIVCGVEYDVLWDSGAMFPMIIKRLVTAESWAMKVNVNYRVNGIAGDEVVSSVVPFKVKLGRGTSPGLWVWGLVIEEMPYPNCGALIDYQTMTVMVSQIDCSDVGHVTMRSRDRQGMLDQIRRIDEAETRPGMSPLVRRVYCLEQ